MRSSKAPPAWPSWKMASMMEKLMTAAHRNPMGRLSRSLFSLSLSYSLCVVALMLTLFASVPGSCPPSRRARRRRRRKKAVIVFGRRAEMIHRHAPWPICRAASSSSMERIVCRMRNHDGIVEEREAKMNREAQRERVSQPIGCCATGCNSAHRRIAQAWRMPP